MKPRAWSNYLTARVRHIPMGVVADICLVLGIKPSEMLARAEARAAVPVPAADLAERAISQTSPEAQEALRKIRADMGHDGEGDAGLGEAANH